MTYSRFNHPEPVIGIKTLLASEETSRPASLVVGGPDVSFIGAHCLSVRQASFEATRVDPGRDGPVLLGDDIVGDSASGRVGCGLFELLAELLVAEKDPVVAVLAVETVL